VTGQRGGPIIAPWPVLLGHVEAVITIIVLRGPANIYLLFDSLVVREVAESTGKKKNTSKGKMLIFLTAKKGLLR
jgi:hypothetical protein